MSIVQIPNCALPVPGNFWIYTPVLIGGTIFPGWHNFPNTSTICSRFLELGYTHLCDNTHRPWSAPETYGKNPGLNELKDQLTNQERDHQALVKKLRERIQELELQSKPTKDLVETIQDYWVAQSRMAASFGDLSSAHDAVKRERDAARATLEDIRSVMNGRKLTP